jgi:chemotaxis response regulator CheB
MSLVRVLVVEDFVGFRRVISSIIGKRRDLQIIGEVSDGLEAVRKAEELQPDLILLDIELPMLNGIEAARQIRRLAPKSKILFLSQESSADVVQEALSFGALGYVVKAHAGRPISCHGRRQLGKAVCQRIGELRRTLTLKLPSCDGARQIRSLQCLRFNCRRTSCKRLGETGKATSRG